MSNVIINTLTYCVVLHPYNTTKADELSLNSGEVIKVLKKADDGWWFGNKIQPQETKGGWFPSNFTLEPSDPEVINKSGSLRYARADFEYVSREEDELSLVPGDLLIVVLSEEDEGWHRGVLFSRFGLFPANFVTMIPKAEYEKLKAAPRSNNASNTSLSNPAMLKTVTEITPQERRASLAIFAPAPIQSPTGEKPDSVANRKRVLCKAIVTFDYQAQQPDELTLTKGMKLDVLEKDDEGWWTGVDEKGKIGVFPFNFVKEIALPNTSVENLQQKPQSAVAKFLNKESMESSQPSSPKSLNSVSSSKPKAPVENAQKIPASVKITNAEPAIAPKPTFTKLPYQAKTSSSETLNSPPPIVLQKPVLKFPITSGSSNTIKKQASNDSRSESKEALDNPVNDQQPKLNHPTKDRPLVANRKPSNQSSNEDLKADQSKHVAKMKTDESIESPETSTHDPLSPLAIPAQPGQNIPAQQAELYQIFYREMERLRGEMDTRLRKEKEARDMMERELVALKRMIDKLMNK